jgi:hypothetical protein
MPNNQDAVREWGLCPLHLHNQKLDCADCQEIREANARLDAKLRAPTPREQELEAQNKALWELVGHVDALLAADERGQGIGYAEAIQRCAKTLAAIQKAKEAKV